MLQQLKENNRKLYLTLLCGGSTLLTLGTLRCLYVNRNRIATKLGLTSPKKCCVCCDCLDCKCKDCKCTKDKCCDCCSCGDNCECA